MKMDQTECSETLAYKFQMPGNHPKESIQHSVHGESLKSRQIFFHLHSIVPEGRYKEKKELETFI